MKSALGKIIISVILLTILLFGLSRIYGFTLLQNKNLKASYVSENKIDADILLHGPCQVLWMVQTSVIEKRTGLKTYNLGLTHADFADNYLYLYLYLKSNKPPEYLFLYISPESMDLNYNTFNSYRFAQFMNDTVVCSVVKECDSSYFRWSKYPFMKYAYYSNHINFNALQGLKHYFTNKELPYYPDGYEPPIAIEGQPDRGGFVQIYPKDYSFEWNEQREKYLRKTILLAQSRGTKVFLYESPVLKEALVNVKNREEIMSKINTLAKEYDVPFLTFENMSIADSSEYYLSSVVTTQKGGTIFSDTLAGFIKRVNKQ